jgi:HSP20 family protein
MLMRTDPFRELDRITQQVLGTPARPAAMPIDAYRSGEQFVVHFDLPGVAPDSIELTVERNVLTVHATRERAASDQEELLIAERPHGTFSRQLFLGESLDTERIDASCADGVLTLRIPIAERAKPRRVEVSVGDRKQTAIEARSDEVAEQPTDERVPAEV